jgi:hypothetical protein
LQNNPPTSSKYYKGVADKYRGASTAKLYYSSDMFIVSSLYDLKFSQLGYKAVQFIVRKNTLPPSSGLKSKLTKKPARSRQKVKLTLQP